MRGGLFMGRLGAAAVGVLALGLVAGSPASAADGDSLTIDLNGLNGYDFDGTAVLTEENGSITVDIQVSGDDVVGDHPVHIHIGTCNALDPNPTYPLADIDADGVSSSTVDGVTLDELLAEPYAINAHLSGTQIPVYTTCGDIVGDLVDGGGIAENDATTDDDVDADEETAEEAAPDEGTAEEAATDDAEASATPDAVGGGTTVMNAPAAGVGSVAHSQAGMTAFLTVVGSMAAVLFLAGVTLRYREAKVRR